MCGSVPLVRSLKGSASEIIFKKHFPRFWKNVWSGMWQVKQRLTNFYGKDVCLSQLPVSCVSLGCLLSYTCEAEGKVWTACTPSAKWLVRAQVLKGMGLDVLCVWDPGAWTSHIQGKGISLIAIKKLLKELVCGGGCACALSCNCVTLFCSIHTKTCWDHFTFCFVTQSCDPHVSLVALRYK